MTCKIGTANSFSCGPKASSLIFGSARGRGTELALFIAGSKHNLKMRLATEIQGDEVSQQNHHRAATESAHQSHENSSDLSIRPNEIAQHLALAAQATNDAVRVWTVATGALSWPQGLEALLGYPPSTATDEIGFWQKQLHPQDRARAAASIREALAMAKRSLGGRISFPAPRRLLP